MAIKKTVRLVDETIKVCQQLSDVGGMINWSGSINAMAQQHSIFLDACTPQLTNSQWNAMYCAYNSYMPHPDIKEEIRMLPWHISEGWQYDEQIKEFLGDKKSALEFIDTIKSWTDAQRLAVIHKAKAFWRQRPPVDDPHEHEED